jgi:hypothetical protein
MVSFDQNRKALSSLKKEDVGQKVEILLEMNETAGKGKNRRRVNNLISRICLCSQASEVSV